MKQISLLGITGGASSKSSAATAIYIPIDTSMNVEIMQSPYTVRNKKKELERLG